MKSGAPPSGWVDYITKLPIAKYDRGKPKPAGQTMSTEELEKPTGNQDGQGSLLPSYSTNKQVKFQVPQGGFEKVENTITPKTIDYLEPSASDSAFPPMKKSPYPQLQSTQLRLDTTQFGMIETPRINDHQKGPLRP